MKLRPAIHALLASGVSLVAAGSLPACLQIRTVDDCNTLVRDVNPVLAEIEAERNKPPTAATYDAIARRYEGLAEALAGRKFRDPSLGKAVDDYREVLAATAKNARLYAKAITSNDARKLSATRAAQAQQNNKERLTFRRIASVCRPG